MRRWFFAFQGQTVNESTLLCQLWKARLFPEKSWFNFSPYGKQVWLTKLVWVDTLSLGWLISTNDLPAMFWGHRADDQLRFSGNDSWILLSTTNMQTNPSWRKFSLIVNYYKLGKNTTEAVIYIDVFIYLFGLPHPDILFRISSQDLAAVVCFSTNCLSKETYRLQRWRHILVLISLVHKHSCSSCIDLASQMCSTVLCGSWLT